MNRTFARISLLIVVMFSLEGFNCSGAKSKVAGKWTVEVIDVVEPELSEYIAAYLNKEDATAYLELFKDGRFAFKMMQEESTGSWEYLKKSNTVLMTDKDSVQFELDIVELQDAVLVLGFREYQGIREIRFIR